MADSMQNEAMERLKQMYSKAQPQSNTQSHRSENVQTEKVSEQPLQAENSIHTQKSENLLDFFMRDKEKSLILLLIVILMSEKADTSLLLALMYLVV